MITNILFDAPIVPSLANEGPFQLVPSPDLISLSTLPYFWNNQVSQACNFYTGFFQWAMELRNQDLGIRGAHYYWHDTASSLSVVTARVCVHICMCAHL